MRKLIPAILLLFNASVAMAAQHQPYEESADNRSSQELVAQAVMNHPFNSSSGGQQAPADVLPGTAAGIGPSSPQPGDYGYSAWSDLRQLNF